MSFREFENFLEFAKTVASSQQELPPGLDHPTLESALVDRCVILLCAKMEQCLIRAIETRCRRCEDTHVCNYAFSVRKETTGKLKIEHVKGTLSRFDSTCKNTFADLLTADSLDVSWDSIVNSRNEFAHHGKPVQMTLGDLIENYGRVTRTLRHFYTSIGLTAHEIAIVEESPIPPTSAIANGMSLSPWVTATLEIPRESPPGGLSPASPEANRAPVAVADRASAKDAEASRV